MAFSLTWLAPVLKAAGLKVAPDFGWEERGLGDVGEIVGVICHHTATDSSLNFPTHQTLIKGREDLRGPLAQLGLGRDGTFYLIAAGKCQHAGQGAFNGVTAGNTHFIGIEAENKGTGNDPWPEVQLDAYRRGVAAILKHLGKGAEFCIGHKEWALPSGRKNDPTFDMKKFRAGVADILNGSAPPPKLIPAKEPAKFLKRSRPTLRRGDDNPLVVTIQETLGIRPTSSHFGPKTEAAVRQFQRDHKLVPDGIVGPTTWKALDDAGKGGAAAPPAAGGGANP